ncbi:GEVED domain-containing protein, partial [Flavobacterium sp.]|uniref:GEVED domain-containing protein n=1 Tax=Flavobacterium sp. TaxID=239 RepID=UPI002FDA5E46
MKKLNLLSQFYFRSILLLSLITFSVTAQPQWISSQVSSNNGNNSSNNPQFNRPSGVLAGDLLLVVITKEKGSQTTYNTPSGWILIRNTDNTDRIGLTTFYRIAGTSEPSTYSFVRNSSTSSGLYTASITVIRGVDPNNPLGNTNTSTGNSTTHTSPAVTSSTGSLVVSLHTVNSTSAQTQSGTDMTNRFQYLNGSNATWSQFMGTFETTVAGNTGTRTTTSGGTRRFVTQQIEFKSKLCPDSVSGVNTLSSNSVVCSSNLVNLTLNTSFSEAGVSYQWQSAAIGTSNWQNITGATSASFNSVITQPLQFRCRIACQSLEAFSAPVTVLLENRFNCYCSVGSPIDNATGITRVVFHTLNQTSNGTPAYTSYLSGAVTTVESGSSYPLSVRVNTGGNYTVSTSVWIDWNQNSIFEDTERIDLGTATNQTNGLTSLSPLAIPIPTQALAGETVMRIRTTYNTNPTACGNQNYSETEDYKINVIKPQSWLGLTSSNWNDGSNWSEGVVPTAETVVSIGTSPFQPEITTHAQAYSLTVD